MMRCRYGMNNLFFLVLACTLASVLAYSGHAGESKIAEPFRGDDPNSPIRITYDDWSAILKQTVLETGRSDRDVADIPRARLGTRSVRGNKSATRNEGNRILVPAFSDVDNNLALIRTIRADLEALPDEVPLKHWPKPEQLAYWLNLYNITVVEQLALAYPVKSLRDLKRGKRKKPSLWDQKLLTVAGVPLSLNDIQYTIIAEKWPSPMPIYGLFQGYVGGPNIRNRAFTGDTVEAMLVQNAIEFVNSNRGMRPDGAALMISTLYRENDRYFPNWESDIKRHLVSLADADLHDRIKAAAKIKATTSDFFIADLYGGTRLRGNNSASNPAALVTAMVRSSEDGSKIFANVTGGDEPGDYNFSIADFSMDNTADVKIQPLELRFPDHVTDYIERLRQKNGAKDGNVEVEEIAEGKTKAQH